MNMKLRFLSAAALACWAIACSSPKQDTGPATYTFRGPTMGTYFMVRVVAQELTDERLTSLQALIEGELEAINAKMSTYMADSELSRFNSESETTAYDVSPAMIEVMTEAREVWQTTGGAYDITIGPLVNAWGFGAEESRPELDPPTVQGLLDQTGFDKLEIDAEANTLRKQRPDLYCDLSSIAKGYAVDRIASALASEQLEDVWVEVGGEVRASGASGEGRPWRLGIERPQLEPGTLQRIVPLENMSVATSGDYRNYRERNGVRFSHIIDPRTGWPIRHPLASVSVIHSRCMIADALATALMVMGPEEGWELALREDLAVLFLIRDGDDFVERATPKFDALTTPEL
ncbi:MAG: FAD:protein FMN transferase [Acidobacteriota bacterium]